MKKIIYVLLIAVGVGASIPNKRAQASETIICPGRGERCAKVCCILGISFWKKKEKGGPGVIIVE